MKGWSTKSHNFQYQSIVSSKKWSVSSWHSHCRLLCLDSSGLRKIMRSILWGGTPPNNKIYWSMPVSEALYFFSENTSPVKPYPLIRLWASSRGQESTRDILRLFRWHWTSDNTISLSVSCRMSEVSRCPALFWANKPWLCSQTFSTGSSCAKNGSVKLSVPFEKP